MGNNHFIPIASSPLPTIVKHHEVTKILDFVRGFPSYQFFVDRPGLRKRLLPFAAEKIKGKILLSAFEMFNFFMQRMSVYRDLQLIDVKKIKVLDFSGVILVDTRIFYPKFYSNSDARKDAIKMPADIKKMLQYANLVQIESIIF